MQKTRRRFLQSVVERAKQRNLLFSRTMKPAKRPVVGCFLHTFLLENEAQTSGKKYRAVTFY